ncbi:hypothetical protein EP331_06885 [bacterium]|nr:MAG: hypothetical protein EP331_06885 [bacterium]
MNSGIDSNLIFVKESQKSWNKIINLVHHLPIVVILYIKRWSFICQSPKGAEFLASYVVQSVLFKKLQTPVYLVVISDLNPYLLAQWAAAIGHKHAKVIWWQEDYHHFEGFSQENYFPLEADFAVVLNQDGFNTVKDAVKKDNIYSYAEYGICELAEAPSNGKIGLACNVLFTPSDVCLEHLNSLRLKLNADYLYLRLHPNSPFHDQLNRFPNWIQIRDKDESIKDFAKEIEYAIIGNSAIQLKLALLGVKIIHVGFLDNLRFDIYGYVRKSIAYGLESLDLFELDDVKYFFEQHNTSQNALFYMVPPYIKDVKCLFHDI